MKKNIILLLCSTTMSYTMEQSTINLVTHSTRASRTENFFPEDFLWQTKNTNLTHLKTYDGTAITMDLKKSQLPGAKHIIGDACTYDFKEQSITIKNAFMERPPTYDLNLKKYDIKNENDCSVGSCINNISRSMIAHGTLEIEWEPYTSIYIDPQSFNRKEQIFNEASIKKDPFTTKIEINLLMQAIDVSCNGLETTLEKTRKHNFVLSPVFIDRIITLSKTFDEILDFYEKNNLGTKRELKERLNQEMCLYEIMVKNNKYMILLPCSPAVGLQIFRQKLTKFKKITNNTFILLPHNQSKIGTYAMAPCNNMLIEGIWHDANFFLTDSLAKFLMNDAYISLNKKHAIEFMKKNFFKNVTVERTTNPHNNRKNVWIIKGTKIFNGAADEKKLNSMPLSYLLFLSHVLQLVQKN